MSKKIVCPTFEGHRHFISIAFSITKFCNKKYFGKDLARSALLVRGQEIIAIGYNHSAEKESPELMALGEVKYKAPGAVLYTTFVPVSMSDHQSTQKVIDSKIGGFVYGYCDPSHASSARSILRSIEKAGIHCIYMRIPEIVQFYRN